MRKPLLLLLLLSAAYCVNAQTETEDPVYTPEVFGAVKAKFETSLYDGKHRFNVRNSRIGVRGLASPYMGYAVQIDFNNEGKFSILDSYASFLLGNFDITLGQQQYRFSTDLDRGPNSSIFSNRSFLAKFLTTYYGSDYSDGAESYYVSSIGSRDIGALARYSFKEIPLKVSFGIFNGSGTNNPEWSDKINVVAKADFGGEEGFGIAASHYNGNTPVNTRVWTDAQGNRSNVEFSQDIVMWGGELRYVGKDYRIEAEYAQRRLKNDGIHTLQAGHVQGYYQFRLQGNAVDYIAPVARWDIGKDIEFLNRNNAIEKFTANRATIGVNLGFMGKIIGSELRLQFEKYFLKEKTSDFAKNPLLQDKITIEVVASF